KDPARARDALLIYQDGLATTKKLADADPSNRLWQTYLFYGDANIGDALAVLGDLDGALSSYQAALRMAENVAAAQPSSPDAQRGLMLVYWRLGTLSAGANSQTLRRAQLASAHKLAEQLRQAGSLNAEQQDWPSLIQQ